MKKIILLTLVLQGFLNLTYSQPGQLDPSFGNNGIVKTDIGGRFNCDYPTKGNQVLLQVDGSMFIIAESKEQTIIVKKLSSGAEDLRYGNKGYSLPVNISASHAVVQKDGKVVIAGATSEGSSAFAIARFNTDGSLDNSFSSDGIQFSDFGSVDNYVNTIALQDDGKIVVGGDASNGSNLDFAIASYNIDGSIDTTFSGDGKQTTDFGSFDYGYSMAIQGDGKILMAGSTPSNSFYDLALARYNSDGSLDNSFSGDGMETTDFNSGTFSRYFLALQNDGKIVVAGDSYVTTPSGSLNGSNYFEIARFNTNGSLDNTFSEDGKQITDANPYKSPHDAYARSLAIQNDGKIVVAGTLFSPYQDTSYFVLVRYNINGSVDKSFSSDGKQITGFNSVNEGKSQAGARSVAIQSDGKIVLAGSTFVTVDKLADKFAVARYNTNGGLDNTFDSDGKLTGKVCLDQGSTSYTCLAIQSDGKIVTAGSAIVRYNKDGSLDNTFSQDGYQTVDSAITSIAIQKDGKIVVAGTTVIARYKSDGSPDNTFSGDGRQTSGFNITSIAIQSDGKIVVGGDSSIARFTAAGNPDIAFGGGGIQKTKFAVASIAVQNDQKIVAAGHLIGDADEYASYPLFDIYEDSNHNFAVARFNTNGSFDKSFGDNGIQTTDFYYDGEYYRYHGDDKATSIAIQNDGKIVIAGRSVGRVLQDNLISDFAFARYNVDGSLDIKQRAVPGLNGQIFAPTPIAVQKNGKIILAGSAAITFDYVHQLSALARFKGDLSYADDYADSSYDNTFGKNGIQITRNVINAIAIADNALYAVGYGQYPGDLGIIEKYFLSDETKASTVALTISDSIVKYLAPARIKLNAAIANTSAAITKVRFYNGSTWLHTETAAPYGFLWDNVAAGNYTLTAKAFDSNGDTIISNSIKITVARPNMPPVVSVVNPMHDTTFTGPATVRLVAKARDTDDKISKVDFYNGTVLLRTEYYYPYTYNWVNIQAGTYTITAKAYDSKGLSTTSAPVKIIVTNAVSRPIVENNKASISLKLSPNPATNVLQVNTSGLSQNKPATLSIISASGVLMKTIQANNQNQQINISSLLSGVYTLKVASGDKVMYKQFVKL